MTGYTPKILITGAVSLLGKYLVEVLAKDFNLTLTSHKTPPALPDFEKHKILNLDVTNKDAVKHLMNDVRPDVVIHLASLSNIDYCEMHPEEAYRVNVEGTKNISKALNSLSESDVTSDESKGNLKSKPSTISGNKIPHLIFISSSMVFHGDSAPYHETDKPNPINVYGKTKAEAEKIVQPSDFDTTIIRFSTLFGYPPAGVRTNDLPYYIYKLKGAEPVHLVTDRFFNPLSAKTAARIIKNIIETKKTGIFHAGGKNRVNRFEFVKNITRAFDRKNYPELFPVPNDFFKHLAPRPIDVTLDTTKIEKILEINLQPFQEELKQL